MAGKMSLEEMRSIQGKRIDLFRQEVDDAPWKRDHDDAMSCLTFEGVLRFGINIFDGLIKADEKLRPAFLRGEISEKYGELIRELFRWWLEPCEAVEEELARLIRKGFEVEGAAEFRKRHAEAKWMLAPVHEALDHERIVELRDAAIDALC